MVGAEHHGLAGNGLGQAMPAGRGVIGDLAMQAIAAIVDAGFAEPVGDNAIHRQAAERDHDDLAKSINEAENGHCDRTRLPGDCGLIRRRRIQHRVSEDHMNEDRFNMDIRKFLKTVGVTSQRKIELAVRDAVADGKLSEATLLRPKMILRIPEIGLEHVIDGEIGLS